MKLNYLSETSNLLIVGFVSILCQVGILRELNVAFFGVELIYILAIGGWLAGTAVGAFAGRRDFVPGNSQLSFLFLCFAFLSPLEIIFIRIIRLIFSNTPGAYLTFDKQMLALFAAILPVSILLGLLFQWSAKAFITGKKTLAQAYAIESLGGLLGGAASTLLMKFGIQNIAIMIICCLVPLLKITIDAVRNKKLLFSWTGIPLTILMLILLGQSNRVDKKLTSLTHPFIVETKDTPYSRVTLTAQSGQISVFENDALVFETGGTAAEEFVHLTALQHANPKHVLVLGGGVSGIITEILKHPVQQVVYVEINRELVDLVKLHSVAGISGSLQSKRVDIRFADPRRFLDKEKNKYDLILVGMPEPTSGQTNRFYTREFFEKCNSRLQKNGVLGLRLRSAENLWTPQLTNRNISIYRALSAVFRDVIVLPGVTNIIVAGKDKLTQEPDILATRFGQREIAARLVSANYLHYLYSNDRYFEIQERLKKGPAEVNTDNKPICYRYALLIWLSKFFPTLSHFNISDFQNGKNTTFYVSLLLILAVVILLARKWTVGRRWLLVAMAGFLGMIFETVLILYYQVQTGILYQDIGILLMTFMAGLALGSIAVNRWAQFRSGTRVISRWIGAGLISSFILLNVLFAWRMGSPLFMGLFINSLLMIITGFFVAGVFAYVSLDQIQNQRGVVSPLYTADLIGGCTGAVIASLIMIPFGGLKLTSWILAILSFIMLFLL